MSGPRWGGLMPSNDWTWSRYRPSTCFAAREDLVDAFELRPMPEPGGGSPIPACSGTRADRHRAAVGEAALAQVGELARWRGVVRDDHRPRRSTARPAGEVEHRDVAEAADQPPQVARADRLGAVLDQQQVLVGERAQLAPRRRVPVRVPGEDRPVAGPSPPPCARRTGSPTNSRCRRTPAPRPASDRVRDLVPFGHRRRRT